MQHLFIITTIFIYNYVQHGKYLFRISNIFLEYRISKYIGHKKYITRHARIEIIGPAAPNNNNKTYKRRNKMPKKLSIIRTSNRTQFLNN